MCLDKPFDEAAREATPRQVVQRCAPLLVMDFSYDYSDPDIQWCSEILGYWSDLGLRRNDRCFVDFCHHQLCLTALIFYALYFFRPDEINEVRADSFQDRTMLFVCTRRRGSSSVLMSQ